MNLKTKVAVFALATSIGGGLMAAPAFGAAPPNDNGTNCSRRLAVVSEHE